MPRAHADDGSTDRSQPSLKPSVQALLDRYYPVVNGFRGLDTNRVFYEWIRAGLDGSTDSILDIGAGPTPPPERSFHGAVRRVVGVDVDPVVLSNTRLDEAHVFDGVHLPFDDGRFQTVYSDWTIEHVRQPLALLREVNRVLSVGGSYWFRTTNRHHYMTAVSAHTPHWFHKLVANRVRALPKESHEPWLAWYRMNTRRVIERLTGSAGFAKLDIRMVEPHPVYLAFNAKAFRVGIAYERLVNRYELLSEFRLVILARAQKVET